MRRGLRLLPVLAVAPLPVATLAIAAQDDAPDPGPTVEVPAAAPFWHRPLVAPPEPQGPTRYLIEAIEVRGNRRTEEALILSEIGLRPGDVLTPDDPRVRLAELRLISLGLFLRADLSVRALDGRPRGSMLLVVDVVERGTLVLSAIHLGTSEATAFWGGLDVTETNFLGRAMQLGGGFVASTTPTVPEAEAGLALSVRVAGPPRRLAGLALSGSALYVDGSEFFQAFGVEDEVDPKKWVAVNTRRVGGSIAVGSDLSRTTRFSTEGHLETINSTLPGIRTRDLGGGNAQPLEFKIHEGESRLASLTALVDFDTRSDPVMPSNGRRVTVAVEAALPVFGSRYTYAKGVVQGSFYWPMLGRHVLAFHGFLGALVGDAPYFNRFFVGDLNLLLPPRSLGLNFATLPSRNLLGTSIEGRRYEELAGRALVEYAVPLWRRGRFVYRGDAFLAFGIFGLAGIEDLRTRDTDVRASLPIDLTADLGVRLDTYIGIFTLSIANGLGRIPL